MELDRRLATEYLGCLWPRRVSEEMQLLEGLISGLALDRSITREEVGALQDWCRRHTSVRQIQPFREIIARIEEACADGVIDEDERLDLLWLCLRFSRPNLFFTSVASNLQRLRGLLAGIAADGAIEQAEIALLRTWLDEHAGMKGYWPFDEIDSLLVTMLSNGVVSEREHQVLLEFCNDFLSCSAGLACEGSSSPEQLLRRVICASRPEIVFPRRLFCLTGTFLRSTHRTLAAEIAELGGRVVRQVGSEVHYLVVGAGGGECWALSCYGRKVEAALALRREGIPLQIVYELDLWDAASLAR